MCARVHRAHSYRKFACQKQPNGMHTAETTGCFGNRLYLISAPALHGSIIPLLVSDKRFPADKATCALLQLGTSPCCSWWQERCFPLLCMLQSQIWQSWWLRTYPPALALPWPPYIPLCRITMKHLSYYSTFAPCRTPQFTKACDSPKPELPYSASSPLPNSPAGTISCQSSSSLAHQDLKVHTFSSRELLLPTECFAGRS